MNLRNLVGLLSVLAMLLGCATSGVAVKDHNILNVFVSPAPTKQVLDRIAEMSRYCGRQLELETRDFPTLKRVVLDYKVKNGAQYFMRLELDEAGAAQTKVSVYHYLNTEVTRRMASQIEQWVVSGSKDCVPGF